MKIKVNFWVLALAGLSIISCQNDDNTNNDITEEPKEEQKEEPKEEPKAKVKVQTFEVNLSTETQIPAIMGREETGTVTLDLFDDNSLDVNFDIKNLKDSDEIIAAHVHKGDVVSMGEIVIDLLDEGAIKFDRGAAKGTLNLKPEQVTALKGDNIYVNVHSKEAQPGLVRGDIGVKVDKAYNVMASPKFSLHTIMNRNETATAYFRLIENKLHFNITIKDLDPTDQIVAAHIHKGDVVSNGEILIDLLPEGITFNDGIAKGVITLDEGKINTFKTGDNYVNIHSAQQQAGLLRGQLGAYISQAYNIPLSTTNQIPEVTGRSETGSTSLRLVGNTLYHKVTINDLASDDSIILGHIHEGAAGATGGVFLDLGTTSASLGTTLKIEDLTEDQIKKLAEDALYVNIHSSQVQPGLVRGQIR